MTVTAVTPGQLSVLVMSTESVLFDGEAFSVSSVNGRGKFDVLPKHTNFISLVRDRLTINNRRGKVWELPIHSGVLKARDNRVEIYIGVG